MIPKIIWQTCDVDYDSLPEYIKCFVETWKEENPSWDYIYQSEEDCRKFLFDNYGNDVVEIYDNLQLQYLKADFWRYHVLHTYGGVYSDIDSYCIIPMDQWLDLSKLMVVMEQPYAGEQPETIVQDFIACVPNTNITKTVLEDMYARINSVGVKNATPKQTGAETFAPSIKKFLPNKDILVMPNLGYDEKYGAGMRHINASRKWSDGNEYVIPPSSKRWGYTNYIDIKIGKANYNGVARGKSGI